MRFSKRFHFERMTLLLLERGWLLVYGVRYSAFGTVICPQKGQNFPCEVLMGVK